MRKSPYRHRVKSHIRHGKRIFAFWRGHGLPRRVSLKQKTLLQFKNPHSGLSVKKKTYLEEFKSNLRHYLRWAALNMYGKKVNELTKEELKNVLQDTLDNQKHYFVESSAEGKSYTDIFKETFKLELSKIKHNPHNKNFPRFRSKQTPWRSWEYMWEDNKFFIIYREDSEVKVKKEVSYEEWNKELTQALEGVRFGQLEKIEV